jgi:hypothetical protein
MKYRVKCDLVFEGGTDVDSALQVFAHQMSEAMRSHRMKNDMPTVKYDENGEQVMDGDFWISEKWIADEAGV